MTSHKIRYQNDVTKNYNPGCTLGFNKRNVGGGGSRDVWRPAAPATLTNMSGR